jgi:queuosine precursor transporter
MDFLIALYIFCVCAAELMGSKTFSLVSFTIFDYPVRLNPTVAIFLIPLIFTINDVITEVYGKERTRSIIRSGLFVIALILVSSLVFTNLPPSRLFSGSEAAYDDIFGKSARIAFASLTAFALAEFMDVYIFSKIRERLGKSKLWLRNNASNFAAQLIDTIIFMTLAFYALDKSVAQNVPNLFSIILPYWLLKCFMSVIETPFVYLGVRWLKGDKK